MPPRSTCAVSVIVPMYNAEKYLSVCLESILIQTFTDFELLVVDDCSTDSSYAIAESYLEKFGGRMKIISLPENTGSGAVPRNVGLDLSCGKYVYFIDNDDFLIDTALEELFNVAEKFQADVVYMEKFFACGKSLVPEKLPLSEWCYIKSFVKEPTLETNDFAELVKKFLYMRYRWPPWMKFLRRDFLIDNAIKFLHVRTSEDVPWTFELVCLAKKILRVPMPLYVSRTNEKSITRMVREPEQAVELWINPLTVGLDYLNEFMSRIEFFKKNRNVRFQVLNLFESIHFQYMRGATKTPEPAKLYEIFLREFSSAGSPNAALISYLLVMNNLYRNNLQKCTE